MTTKERLAQLRRQVDESVLLRQAVFEQLGAKLLESADVISGVIGAGGKVMIVGNGTLAATASSFAASLLSRVGRNGIRQSLPAMALCVDSTVVTGTAEDHGFDSVYVRQIDGLGHKGDLLLLLSTNGNSASLIRAAQAARERGILTMAFLGGAGGKLKSVVDRALIIPHPVQQRVEEEHLFIIHLLVDLVERDLFTQ